jgi:hypothetical protein
MKYRPYSITTQTQTMGADRMFKELHDKPKTTVGT